jgi:hypothetical protein
VAIGLGVERSGHGGRGSRMETIDTDVAFGGDCVGLAFAFTRSVAPSGDRAGRR